MEWDISWAKSLALGKTAAEALTKMVAEALSKMGPEALSETVTKPLSKMAWSQHTSHSARWFLSLLLAQGSPNSKPVSFKSMNESTLEVGNDASDAGRGDEKLELPPQSEEN